MLCFAQLAQHKRATAPGGGTWRVRAIVARVQQMRVDWWAGCATAAAASAHTTQEVAAAAAAPLCFLQPLMHFYITTGQ